jgi:hypothetical protein
MSRTRAHRRRLVASVWTICQCVPLALALLCIRATPAQAGEAPPVTAEREAPQSEELRVANRPIIELRGPIAGHTAGDRVTNTLARIHRALSRTTQNRLTLEDRDYGTLALIDKEPAFDVTRIDIQQEIGETTHIVADEARKRLERAIGEYHEQHSKAYLLRAAGYAGGATLVYILLIVLLRRLTRRSSQTRKGVLACAAVVGRALPVLV